MLTTRQFAARHAEFEQRGVAIVRIFRSPVQALQQHATGPHAVPFAVLADPKKGTYRLYGVGGGFTWMLSLFRPATHARILQARREGLKPRWRDAIRDGMSGNPADFLIGRDGRIVRAHYGKHFADSVLPKAALAWIDAAYPPAPR